MSFRASWFVRHICSFWSHEIYRTHSSRIAKRQCITFCSCRLQCWRFAIWRYRSYWKGLSLQQQEQQLGSTVVANLVCFLSDLYSVTRLRAIRFFLLARAFLSFLVIFSLFIFSLSLILTHSLFLPLLHSTADGLFSLVNVCLCSCGRVVLLNILFLAVSVVHSVRFAARFSLRWPFTDVPAHSWVHTEADLGG